MWITVPKLGRYIFNAVFIAGAVTVLAMIFIIPAAYAFARFEFRGKALTLSPFLAVNVFASAVLLIPLYRALRTLGLLNTYFDMIRFCRKYFVQVALSLEIGDWSPRFSYSVR